MTRQYKGKERTISFVKRFVWWQSDWGQLFVNPICNIDFGFLPVEERTEKRVITDKYIFVVDNRR